MTKNILAILVLIAVVVGGAYFFGTAQHEAAIGNPSSASLVVYQFGSTMQKVSLSAPDAKNEIAAAYSPYASANLIAQWQSNIPFAPGKGTSNPWPDRIQIDSMNEQSDGSYIVHGTVIEVTSKEVTSGGTAGQYPITLTLKKTGDQWLITSFERGAEATST